MASIETSPAPHNTARDIFLEAAQGGARASENSPDAKPATQTNQERTIQDTVSLSEGGEKIVNLNRAQQLASELKNAPVDETYADTLKRANDDVMRITELFRETVRAAFGWWR